MSATAAVALPEIKVKDIITLTARLAQLLAEEVDHLAEMKIHRIEDLQQEKLFLINALDSQRRLAAKYPQLVQNIPAQDKRDLQEVVRVFNNVVAENHRKLLLAKEVNHNIVQAITRVVKQNTASKVYGARGTTYAAPYETLSVTLNKRI